MSDNEFQTTIVTEKSGKALCPNSDTSSVTNGSGATFIQLEILRLHSY